MTDDEVERLVNSIASDQEKRQSVRWFGNQMKKAQARVVEAEIRLGLCQERNLDTTTVQIECDTARHMNDYWADQFRAWLDGLRNGP